MARLELIKGGMPDKPKSVFTDAAQVENFMDRPVSALTPEQFYKLWPTEESERYEVGLAQANQQDEARQPNLYVIQQGEQA